MRRTINIIALLFLAWLVIDTFHVSDILVSFLLIGAVPGSDTTLSPSMMLAIMTTIAGIIVFELLARRYDVLRKTRYHFLIHTKKHDRLPKRRFGQA